MSLICRPLYCLILLLITGAIALGQQDGQFSENEDTLIVNLADYLPPLNVMIDSAIANSPEADYFLYRQRMFEYEEAQEKKEWLNNIQVSANYFGGNNAFFGNALTLSGYNYGVGVNIPIGQIFTRADRINMAHSASLSEEAKKREQERILAQKVEETYTKLFMLKELIAVTTEAKESAKFIYEQAETRFVRGELSLDELGQNNDLKTKWASTYITQKNEFYQTYRLLQLLVVVPFSKFNLD